MFGSRVAVLSGGAANLRQGLVSYWRFDDASGSSVADAVGGNTGTWQGTLGSQWGTGKIAGGGVFNGTDNSVAIGSAGLSLNDYTYVAWVYPTALPGAASEKGIVAIGGVQDQSLNIDNTFGGRTGFSIVSIPASGGTSNANAGILPATNQWHHVVGMRDTATNTLRLYVNGVLAATSGALTSPTAGYGALTTHVIGSRSTNFAGLIDEAGIWSRALSATEVQQLWNGGSGRAYPW